MPKIYLYAEILIHIRQLTLYASLQTEKAEGTKVDVSSDKKVITVIHDGEAQKLYLPTQISGTAKVTFPIEKKTEISARVQIEDEFEWKSQIKNEIEAPWMASDLTSNASIQCLHCKSTILNTKSVETWKALPSENWAEFMDFWFCHKPHDDGQNDAEEAAKVKGFSSKSKLAVMPGTGMTDLASIVLHAEDCTNIKAAETLPNNASSVLRCQDCTTILGSTKEEENLIQLNKSSISVREPSVSADYQSYHSAIFTCARILSLIEATSIKKFVVHGTSNSTEQDRKSAPLLVWVFNPDIYYSCSAYDTLALRDLATAAPNSGSSEDHSQSQDKVHHITIDNMNSTGDAIEQITESKQHNPNNDDTSQIYGDQPLSQFIAGNIEVEVPVGSSSSDSASTAHNSVEAIRMTETDLPPLLNHASTNTQPTQPTPTNSTVTVPSQPQSQNDAQDTTHHNLVHRAAKIFYQPLSKITHLSPPVFLDQPANSTAYEELFLADPHDLAALWETLEASTSMLPQSARNFQDWSVGLLERYEKIPSGLGVMQDNPLARGISARDGRVTRWDIGHGAEGLYA